ncbi:hypothetical protein ACVWZV_008368 [Bradyrhizobium sp. GM5.1]
MIVGGKALDRGDLLPLGRERERQARHHAPVVDQYRAGTTLAVVAALFAAGELEMLPQRVEHRRAGVDAQALVLAVDPQRDIDRKRRILGGRHARILRGRTRRHGDQRAAGNAGHEGAPIESGRSGT